MIDLARVLPSTGICRRCPGSVPMQIITNFRPCGTEARFKLLCENGKHERLITITDDELGLNGHRKRKR